MTSRRVSLTWCQEPGTRTAKKNAVGPWAEVLTYSSAAATRCGRYFC